MANNLPFGKFVVKHTSHTESATRQNILLAALKSFAQRGYAATSVQDIVDAAKVTKPVLYYYFADKARLFEALVAQAHEERYRRLQEAACRGRSLAEKLEEIVAAIFEFSLENQDLMRLAFATAFAAEGEAPGGAKCAESGRRNFELIRSLVEQGQASGELTRTFKADDLAMGLYGQFNMYVMVRLIVPDCPLDRQAAHEIVRLFLQGAAPRPSARKEPALQSGSNTAAGAVMGKVRPRIEPKRQSVRTRQKKDVAHVPLN